MRLKELDTVVLTRDLPDHGLKTGDLGAVVHVNSPASIEVEFVTATGGTQAVVTLDTDQVRRVGPHDLLAVRRVDAA
jgi:hypothetical protein